jgi:hypothetical protein
LYSRATKNISLTRNYALKHAAYRQPVGRKMPGVLFEMITLPATDSKNSFPYSGKEHGS